MAGIQDGVAILSDQGQIVAHNDRLAQVLRIDATRLTGRPLLADVIATANWQTDTSPDGTTSLTLPGIAHAERRDSPLPGGGAVVLIAETTERRQVDDRLRQIQRIEALGKVSGEVAHDFGNILSTISSSLHLMEGAPPERQGGLRQTIASAVEIGSALTGRLLAFARRQHLAPETVDLPSLVEGMADLAGFALRDEIDLVLDLPDTPLPVRVARLGARGTTAADLETVTPDADARLRDEHLRRSRLGVVGRFARVPGELGSPEAVLDRVIAEVGRGE